ncbi:MAG: PEP-CTERM sorting domain-containing protein [bacterium]|nr:PEP-CTERM sorting domain-containing protein [bacterium]
MIRKSSSSPHPVCALLVLAFLLSFVTAPSAQVVSGFDVDQEGWQAYPVGETELSWVETGGVPGGYVRGVDIGSGWAYVEAPAAFATELDYPGLLAFDLRAFTSDPGSYPIQYDVRVGIEGNGLVLLNELSLPDGVWRSYEFILHELAGWRIQADLNQNYDPTAPVPTPAELESVLVNATRLVIAADYGNGTTGNGTIDEAHLDNVFVPEPTGAIGLALGLVMLGTLSRSRRS